MLCTAQANIAVVSFSLGAKAAYTRYSRDIDIEARNNPETLWFVAAGNDGDRPPMSHGTQVNAPANAKNIVCVGATNGASNMASFSSKGFDSRSRPILPTVVANGVRVYSASNGVACEIKSKQGTSMATPSIAGMAAVLR